MILTCPQCESQFELDVALLQPDGKRVRCASCSHDWFQLPDPEEESTEEGAADDAPQENEAAGETPPETDIPEGVKPKQEGASIPPEGNKVAGIIAHVKDKNNLIGYGAAVLVFMLILMTLAMFSGGISKAWPPMKGFYNVIGVHVPSAGEGLSFEGVSATYASGGDVKIVGEILNLTSHDTAVPQLKASMIIEGEALPMEWPITAPAAMIEANGKLHFTSEHAYDGAHRPKSVTVGFDIMGHHVESPKAAVEHHDEPPAHAPAHAPKPAEHHAPPAHH